MAEVFISYSQKDRALVAPIAAALEELGVDFWYDPKISPGESIDEVIRAQLKVAKAVLVCWSPEAERSPWVNSEAEYARVTGSYIPVFVTRCTLMPPFNLIQTVDLSKWMGARDDPDWLKLVTRLAALIGREGIAAGAEALAKGDDAAKYEFARRFPDERLARKIWASAEARLRAEFANRLAEARGALEARLNGETPAFEAWLAEERRGAAKGPKPDPLAAIEAKAGAEKALLQRIDILSDALTQAKAREGELDQAKAEVERLVGEVAAAEAAPAPERWARSRALIAIVAVLALALVGLLTRDTYAPASSPQAVAQLQVDLTSAKRAEADAEANAAKLRADLSASQADAQVSRDSVAATAKQPADATAALAAANDQVAKLRSDLAARPSQPPAGADPAKSGVCASLAPPASRTSAVLSAAEECGLKPKDAFRECADCPTMMVIPAGSFTMGSPNNETGHSDDEGPRHDVRFAKPFAVGTFAVTFDEWGACVADGGCGTYVPDDLKWGRDKRPAINVSWNDSQAYVAWLSKKTGKPYRLLSESEWEYAARAGATTAFWQGATLSPSQANYDGTRSYNGGPTGEYRKQTIPVGSFAPNGFGLFDMNGNVWQWVADCYRAAYREADGSEAPTDGSEWKTTGSCSRRVVRGGSWFNSPVNLRSAVRSCLAPELRHDYLGFRLARTLTP
jgi:formylglycine-generating enzyme required for sulfatase activity